MIESEEENSLIDALQLLKLCDINTTSTREEIYFSYAAKLAADEDQVYYITYYFCIVNSMK